jgi:hypothetical protein
MSHVGHVIRFFVDSNGNLDARGNGCAIQVNWRVNCSNRKFGGGIEKWVIIQGGKV